MHPNNLIEFYLGISVTMLTLDGFDRRSNAISVTPWKLSGKWKRTKSWKLPSIRFATGSFFCCCQYIEASLRVILVNSRAHHSCVEKQEKLSGSTQPFTSSDQYSFQILLCQMDISTFSWQTKVAKSCPKYLLTLHQNWSFQYQIQTNSTSDIKNVKAFLPCMRIWLWRILRLSVQYVLLFWAAHDLTSWPSG